ncbi:MAG: hypothetical protein CL466_02040 [Acidimicrobiaceae bacterium]|nr:hypothetical protein [Acidimicrobiaceae bacterium]
MSGEPAVDRPLFTVVVPTFNREAHIGRCLASVEAQGFDDLEVVVVDNASTDDTVAVARRCAPSLDVRVLVNDANHERSYSRNRGAEEAWGRYVVFLDSDDVLEPGALAGAADYVAEDPSRSFFFQVLRIVDEAGATVYRPRVGRGSMARVLAGGNPLSCSGVYVDRGLFLRHRFDETPGLVASEDWHCWLRVAAEELPTVCPGVGALLVNHAGRTMAVDPWATAERRFALLTDDLFGRPEMVRFLEPHRRLFLATQDHYVAVKAAAQGAFGVSFSRFLRSARRCPRLVATRRTLHLVRLWLRLSAGRRDRS